LIQRRQHLSLRQLDFAHRLDAEGTAALLLRDGRVVG
jgi:hypothetical protein